jgi:hypothetical protein
VGWPEGANVVIADPNTASKVDPGDGQAAPLLQDETFVPRSTNGGATWTGVRVLGRKPGEVTCSNTALVYDLAVAPQAQAAGSLPGDRGCGQRGRFQPGVAATTSLYSPAFFLWPASQVVATRQRVKTTVTRFKAGTFADATTIPAKPGEVIILIL